MVKLLRKHVNLGDKKCILLSPSDVSVRKTRDHGGIVLVHVDETNVLDLNDFEYQVADALTNWGHEGPRSVLASGLETWHWGHKPVLALKVIHSDDGGLDALMDMRLA